VRQGTIKPQRNVSSEPVAARSGTGAAGRLPSSQAGPWKSQSPGPTDPTMLRIWNGAAGLGSSGSLLGLEPGQAGPPGCAGWLR